MACKVYHENRQPGTPDAYSFRMQSRIHLVVVCTLLICLLLPSSPYAASEPQSTVNDHFIFGVFPYLSARQLGNSYGPVAAEFGRVLGREVRFTSTSSYEDFSRGLAEERFDIAMIQPFDYVKAVDHHNYLPLARVDADLRALFVVKPDSPIQGIEDLRGTRVALPSVTAALSRVSLKALRDAGLEIGKDVQIHHFKSFGSCMQDVLLGNSSACATGQAAKKIFEQRMQIALTTIYRTPPIPHMTFVAHKRLPENERRTLRTAIVNWKNDERGKRIIEGTRLPGFRELVDEDYDVIRDFEH